MSAGDTLRDEAFRHLDLSDCNDENTLLREVIIDLARRKITFSSNDLPQEVRDRTTPNRRGRVFRMLIEEGVIEECGFVKSSNPKAKGHRVLVYRWAERNVA